jgi:hypothetical protein
VMSPQSKSFSPNTEWPYSVADPIVTNQVEYHPFLGQEAVRRCRHHHHGTSSRRGRSRARCRTMRETSRQIGPICVGIKETHVGNQVLVVIRRQDRVRRRGIGNVWIERRLRIGASGRVDVGRNNKPRFSVSLP